MAPIRAGGGRLDRDGLRADKSSAIAQRRGDPCPQSHSSSIFFRNSFCQVKKVGKFQSFSKYKVGGIIF